LAISCSCPVFWLDKVPDISHVAITEQHQAAGRQTIPPGPSDLLVVGFQAFRQIMMDDETNIGLLIPMPKAIVATMIWTSSLTKRF